jgi:hypothetical protein
LRFLKTWDDVRVLVSTGHVGELIVYQPLKDLSLALDGLLTHALGHGTYHFTNLVLWFLCSFFAFELLEEDPAHRPSKLALSTGVLLFAFHPLFVGSVAWVSARKHLLAFLFILLASWELVRDEKPRKRVEVHWRALGWYGLALLCQPIQVLWPLWALARAALIEKGPRQRIFYRTALVALVPLALAAAVNVAYYSGLYVKHTTVAKFVPLSRSGVAVPLLAIGRYVANLLYPLRLAPVYEPASMLGIAGLLALPILLLGVRKLKSSRLIASWLIFGALPILVVTARMTQVFVSDTYALSAGFGCLACALIAWDELAPRGRAVWAAPVLLLLVYLGVSIPLASSWSSDQALWARAAEVEPTGRTLALHARFLLDTGRFEEALQTNEKLRALAPDEPALSYLAARLVAEDSRLSLEQRARILEETSSPSRPESDTKSWSAYFLAQLEAREAHYDRASRAIRQALSSPRAFGQDLPTVVAELQFFCQQAGRLDCPDSVAALRERIEALGLYWDSRPYNDRLHELNGL